MSQVNNNRAQPMALAKIYLNSLSYTKFINDSFFHFDKSQTDLD